MFYRAKFVTNSSSTSYAVFGVGLNRKQMDQLIQELCVRNKDTFEKKVKGYFDDANDKQLGLGLARSTEEILHAIHDTLDSWELDEFLEKFLPDGFNIVNTYDDDDSPSHDYYISLSRHINLSVEGDRVVITNYSAESILELIGLLRSIGIEDPKFELDEWVRLT